MAIPITVKQPATRANPRRWAHRTHLLTRLTLIWIELWPLLLPLIHPWLTPVTLFLLARYTIRGDYTRNLTDTTAAIITHQWRIRRLTNPRLPKLLDTTVTGPWGPIRTTRRRRATGRWGIPADTTTITCETPDNIDDLTDWLTKTWRYSTAEPGASPRDHHLTQIRFTHTTIPDLVTATEDYNPKARR